MRNLVVLLLLCFTFSVEAKPHLFCRATRTLDFKADGDAKAKIEKIVHADIPLNFDPFQRNEFRAQEKLIFPNLPEVTTELTIIETLFGQELSWSSQMVTSVGSGDVVVRGPGSVSFSIPNTTDYAQIECDLYEKTEALIYPQKPITVREELRIRKLGGPGSTRELNGSLGPLETFDLFNLILRERTKNSSLVTKTIEALNSRGFALSVNPYLDSEGTDASVSVAKSGDVCTDPKKNAFSCDVENFQIRLVFSGAAKFLVANPENIYRQENYLYLVVNGLVFREDKSRLIRGFSIGEVSVVAPRDERGGGSSTSGGRIKGGN